MKLSNSQLAHALALSSNHPLHRAVAQSICDRPNSRRFNSVGERFLELKDIPTEGWSEPLPTIEAGVGYVSLAIERLNSEFDTDRQHRLRSIVALRRLAWYASQLARRMEYEDGSAFVQAIALNGGHTANIFHPPIYKPMTPAAIKEYGPAVKLDSADGRNAVLVDALAAFQHTAPQHTEKEVAHGQ